jgi:leader peptidase (prepilin peptidase)/N-methyltransferase
MYLLGAAAKSVFKKEALGEGDIKLLVMFGANIGIERTLIAIFGGSIIGAIVGIILIFLKKMKEDDYIPFAPFLALGAIVSILTG